MTDKGDTRSARWKRRLAKWRKWEIEMREEGGAEVTWPADVDTPPHKRGARG